MKGLYYAYPTSPNAERYNKGKGCWFVIVAPARDFDRPSYFPPAVVFQEHEKWEALALFEEIEAPSVRDTFDRTSDVFGGNRINEHVPHTA